MFDKRFIIQCFWCEQGQSNAIVAVIFDPDDSKTLVTCGKEHIYFWRLHNTRLERKNGYFEVHFITAYKVSLEIKDYSIEKGN